MPFDFAKTQMQKESYLKLNTFNIIKSYANSYGFSILYTGWQFRSFQYIVNSIFTVVTLDSLERKVKTMH